MLHPLLDWQELKNRSDIHLARKIWHISTVFMMFSIHYYAPSTISAAILILAFVVFISVDFFRLRFEKLNQFALALMGPLMRQQELKGIAGTTYLLSGVLVIFLLFSKPIVSLSILFLAFADPIASYVGIRYGKDKILGGKTIQGFLAAYVVCALITFVFLNAFDMQMSRQLVVALLAGFVGALAELVPVAKLDDNFTMPILSAIGLSFLFYFFDISNNIVLFSF
jgi:diacylglycerol kinase (CTP)